MGQTPYMRSKSWAIKLCPPVEGMNHLKPKKQDPMQPTLAENHFSTENRCSSVWVNGHYSLTVLTKEKIPLWSFMLSWVSHCASFSPRKLWSPREDLGVLQDRCSNRVSSGPSEGRHRHSESSVCQVPVSSAYFHRALDTQQTHSNCQGCLQPDKIALKSTYPTGSLS